MNNHANIVLKCITNLQNDFGISNIFNLHDIQSSLHNNKLYVALTVPKLEILKFEIMLPKLQTALETIPDVEKVIVTLTSQTTENNEQTKAKRGSIPDQKPIPHVKHIIAISSAKGGVGKSTITANLAVRLAQKGLNIGVLDVDIYGPSQPTLFGVANEKPFLADDGVTLLPIEAYGVKLMSIGFLLKENDALIWRGPMVISAITQLLYEVEWGTSRKPLDILLLDLPPGTGDAHLSIVQKVPLSGVVIISTPQEMALADVRRGITMFNRVHVPIIGLVQNMQIYECENCGHKVELFSASGAEKEVSRNGIKLISTLPISMSLRILSDKGIPLTLSTENSTISHEFNKISDFILDYINR